MSTFSKQNTLPSLPVPKLHDTLEKYFYSASALLSDVESKNLRQEINKFEKSDLAKQLQEALENRAKEKRNWLDDWWYDAYNECRVPLAPYLSFAALNSIYQPIQGGQLSRAADVLHHWVGVWNKVRHEKWPIASSRGVTWDMIQFHYLFNSSRTPQLPKDSIERYFRTKAAGDCPHHAIVCCNGELWKVECLNADDTVKSPDQLYAVLKFIRVQSRDCRDTCIAKLTTSNRDVWAENRSNLMKMSDRNAENLRTIEEGIMFISLVEKRFDDVDQLYANCLMDESWFVWQDKSVSITVYDDAQVAVQGDHSNIDAIVLLQAGDDVAFKIRRQPWQPVKHEDFPLPIRLDFDLNDKLKNVISDAHKKFYETKSLFRGKAIHYFGYGNDKCRAAKVYTDTVIQLVLQIAYARTHGVCAPIYETASTRQFYHGRTETVRGCTPEFVRFAKALLDGNKKEDQKSLFHAAIAAHDKLMGECMTGNGIDRHILGLKKTLEAMNGKGCGPKRSLPSFLSDETWKKTGGDGNFLLSTSFIGYMVGDEPGTYGYVSAMRPDGYGCFYKIGKSRITVSISDWIDSKSNLDTFGDNLKWAFDRIAPFLQPVAPQSNSKI